MNYTDKFLLNASQIAYYDINNVALEDVTRALRTNGVIDFSSHYTLKELYDYSDEFRESIYISVRKSLGLGISEDVSTRAKALERADNAAAEVSINYIYDIIDELQKDEAGSIGSWKLVSFVFNDDVGKPGVVGKLKADGSWDYGDGPFSPSGDGLCAYVFETADDSAIVAFRGSQPLNCLDDVTSLDFVSDWLASDFGLALDEHDTPQQQSTYEYIKQYVHSLDYENYAFAGHSLGGNLAMHAAVSMYKVDTEEYTSKAASVSQVSSFDGPGYNNGYLERYADEISAIRASDTIQFKHYMWSIVGELLTQYALHDQAILVGYDMSENGDFHVMDGGLIESVTAHNPAYVQFDETGTLIGNVRSNVMQAADSIVDFIYNYPEELRPNIVNALFCFFEANDILVDEIQKIDGVLSFFKSVQHQILKTIGGFYLVLKGRPDPIYYS